MKIKKIMAVVSAVALTFAVGMTSFAAPSVTGGITGGGAAPTESGKEVQVVVTDPLANETLSEVQKEAVNKLTVADESEKEAAKQEALEQAGVTVPEGEAATVLGVVDIELIGYEEGDTVYVTVSVPAAKMGDNIIVLHFNEETGVWENIDAEVTADGQVRLTIRNASPFAFIVIAATTDDGGTGGDGGKTEGDGGTKIDTPTKGSAVDGVEVTTPAKTAKASSTTSPKTGEGTMVLVLGMVALAAAGSAFGLKKRA